MFGKHGKHLLLVIGLALMLVSGAAMAQTPADAVADCVANSGVFPAGTSIVNLSCDDVSIAVDLSVEAVPFPFTDTMSDSYTEALFAAVSAWPEISSIQVTVGGTLISAFLPANTSPDYGPGGDFTVNSLEGGPSWSVMSAQSPIGAPNVTPLTDALAGKLIVLGPSHGSVVASTGTYWSRAMRTLCGPNPVTNRPAGLGNYQPSDYYYWTKSFRWAQYYEDDMSPELIRYVYAYCKAAGADTYSNRNLDKTSGIFPAAAYGYPAISYPRWQVAAKYHLQDLGTVPESVWNTSALSGQSDKDIRARAYYANWLMQTLGYNKDNSVYLALHSNAAGAGTARGTETLHSLAYTTWTTEQAASPTFCGDVNNGIINSVRNEYDGFWADSLYVAGTTPPEWPTASGTYRGYNHAGASTGTGSNGWQNRGVKGGNYGEVRECKMPAALTELVFHDNWKFYPDQVFHQDQIFRATVAWGIYEGISNFFGVTPMPRLAASVDSVSFPQFVAPGQAIAGTISMKNLGQAWCWGDKQIGLLYVPYTVWNLQATADDQFAAGTKIAIADDGNYYPGDTAAFSVALTAPAETGYFNTSWQMLKDDARGGLFGAVASASIGVDGIAPEITITAPEDKWYNGDPITVGFSATDNMSGVDTITANVDATAIADGEAVSGLANGTHILSVVATDKVGNEATKTQSFKVDLDAPVITVASPASAGYLQTGNLGIIFSSEDPLSGVASISATLDGAPVNSGFNYSLLWAPLGAHTVVVTSTDNVGNESSSTVTFTIGATIESMISAVNELYAQGQIDNEGIQNSLLVKLAKYAKDSGDVGNTKNYLKNFINEVNAQSGQHITVAAANILLADAQYVIAQLPAE